MKSRIHIVILVAALVFVGATSGCNILDEKKLDVILKSETCAEFSQNSTSEQFVDVATIDIQRELEAALENNGYARGDITNATLVGAFVGTTSFTQDHDWIISGRIDVEYLVVNEVTLDTTVAGGPATLLDYTEQSVQDALDQKLTMPLTDAGVAVLQQSIDQFLAHAVVAPDKGVLRFRIVNGSARNPDGNPPSVNDPIIFDWKAWLVIHLVVPQTVEVPDPF